MKESVRRQNWKGCGSIARKFNQLIFATHAAILKKTTRRNVRRTSIDETKEDILESIALKPPRLLTKARLDVFGVRLRGRCLFG